MTRSNQLLLDSTKESAFESIREITAAVAHIEQSCMCTTIPQAGELDDAAFCLATAQTHTTNIIMAIRKAKGGGK